ncbi:MAG: hypothetical protein QNK35_12625 [Bacteroides sp.]|nr:hypothetical protein [Bacteroides sp.]
MKNRQHHFRPSLKNFFFNNENQKTSIPISIGTNNEEEKNLREYIESYQKVTRWK